MSEKITPKVQCGLAFLLVSTIQADLCFALICPRDCSFDDQDYFSARWLRALYAHTYERGEADVSFSNSALVS